MGTLSIVVVCLESGLKNVLHAVGEGRVWKITWRLFVDIFL